MSIKRKVLTAAAGLLLAGGLGLATAGNAHATVNEGVQYSTYLAGHSLLDNGTQTYNAVWGSPTVPSLGTATANTVAVGVVLAVSPVSESTVYGEGLVWDAADGSTCPASTWTLEAGVDHSPTDPADAPFPVPVSDLNPLEEFGADVCIYPGGSEFLKIQQSTKDDVVSFLAGPDSSDSAVLLQDDHVHVSFEGAGEGVTSQGVDAETIPLGTLVTFNTFAVNRLAAHSGGHATGVAVGVAGNGGSANWETWDSTVSGGSPTVSNPLTLTASGFSLVGYGTKNSILVP